MAGTHHSNRLHKQLANLIALEAAIEQKLEELLPEVSDHDEATDLLRDFLNLPRDQRQALETRLNALSENAPQMTDPSAISIASGISQGEEYPVSTTLQVVHTMFNQAVINYSVMHPLATRFLDSSWIADEGTAYHLARQHTKNYVQAVQQISRLLHDVVLWELDQEGYECQCICPSCGAGICLCSMAGRLFLSQVWEEAGPIFEDEGVYVQLPKMDSAASRAGLVRGDVILAAEGDKIESLGDMQSAIRNAEPGEGVQLSVRHHSNELEEVALNL